MSQNQIEENKKPYQTPALTKLGKVEEVTQGVNISGTDTGTVSI